MSDRIKQLQHLIEEMEVIDLSHMLEENIPVVPKHARFGHNLYDSYKFGNLSCHYQIVMSEHSGTHLDAPLHFIAEGPAHYGIDQVPLTQVSGRAAMISAVGLGENGLLSRGEIEEWEGQNGALEAGDIVLIHTGWDRFWKKRSEGNEFMENWPGLSKEAAVYLVEKQIKLVGTDAVSLDAASNSEHPAHYELLGNQVLIIENLNNLSRLPAFSYFTAYPLKIRNGSGSPIRAVAYIPKS